MRAKVVQVWSMQIRLAGWLASSCSLIVRSSRAAALCDCVSLPVMSNEEAASSFFASSLPRKLAPTTWAHTFNTLNTLKVHESQSRAIATDKEGENIRQTLLLLFEQQCHFSIRRLPLFAKNFSLKGICRKSAFFLHHLEGNNERIELPIEQQHL